MVVDRVTARPPGNITLATVTDNHEDKARTVGAEPAPCHAED